MSQLAVNSITDANAGNTATINGMTPTADSLQGFRNRIINGDMRIDQRNAGGPVTVNTSPVYPVDRFYCSANASGVFTAQRSNTAPTGFINSTILTVTTARASIAASDVYGIRQPIEGFNTADFGFGTASAKSITLSFWVRSSVTGTYAVAFWNNAFNRNYVATYTVNSANTFEYKTITISGDTTGTWTTDNTAGLTIYWDLGSGSNYVGTAGSWAAGGAIRTSGSTNWISTNLATFYITGVQLEVGSVATPFERRPYGTELSLCERYYEKSYAVSVAPGTITSNNGWAFYFAAIGASAGGFSCTWRTRKRAAPTVVVYSTITGASGQINAAGTDVSATISGSSEVSAFIYSGSSSNNYWHTTASAEL